MSSKIATSFETPRSSLLDRTVWTVLPPLVKGLGRLAWRLEVDLGNGFPDPPFVVASNHFSFLDGLLIGAVVRQKVRFLALVDLFGNYRWLDFALATCDVIPLRRGVVPLGPMRTALRHLARGGTVGLFPEGTRRRSFDPMRARPGAAWLAAQTGVPLVPVAVIGTDRILGIDNRLHPGRIQVAVGPVLQPAGTDRSEVDRLMAHWGGWVSNHLTTAGTTR